MWFALGIITFIGVALGIARFRLARRWEATLSSVDGISYLWKLDAARGQRQRAWVGIECQTDLEFCLKQEGLADRFFKSIGLSQEQQLNRVHFDQSIYMMSDDRRLGRLLKYEESLCRELETLFGGGDVAEWRIDRLWCQGGRVWIETSRPPQDSRDLHPLVSATLPLLIRLGRRLSEKIPEATGTRDAFVLKAAILIAVSTALFASGVLFGLKTFLEPLTVIDDDAFLSTVGVAGAIATGILVVLCIVLLGRTSRAHLVLGEVLLLGGIGSFMTAFAGIELYNSDFDTSVPWEEKAEVVHRYTERCGSKNRQTCYYILVGPTPTADRQVRYKVSSYDYEQFQKTVTIQYRSGALGFRWARPPSP